MIVNEKEIQEALSIDQVIGQFLDLKKSGSNLEARCPFHQENTPSFKVNVSKGIYKCFGCGSGGDAIEFLKQHEQMSYPEALEWMAEQAGISIEYEKGIDHNEVKKRKQRHRALQTSLNALVDEQIHTNGEPSPDSSFDLDGRPYKQETATAFRLFYAEPGWCQESDVNKGHLQQLGLIKNSQKFDGLYEFFRHRWMFPITNVQGNVLGFGGRIDSDHQTDKTPKYLNSTESVLYKKGKVLYGLEQARKRIRDKGFAYLVEGYTDVLTMYDGGIENAVAACGTAFTEDQAKVLSRYTDHLHILMDGDPAGKDAAVKDIRECIRAGLQPRVIFLPDGMDPDDYIRDKGADDLKAYNDSNHQDGIMYLVMKDYDKNDAYRVSQSIKLAADILADIPDEALRYAYLDQISEEMHGSVKRKLKDQLKLVLDERVESGMSQLTKKQQQDVIKYRIYEQGKCYYLSHDRASEGVKISNFIIRPIMIIIGRDQSARLVEVINKHGHRFVEPIDSDAFVELNGFKKAVESQGNFVFEGSTEDFLCIKKKIYDDMPACYPIQVMGWHPNGFYAWANGISKTDGTFQKVDEYGIVAKGDKKFYLPAFSKANQRDGLDDDGYEDLRKFIYKEGDAPSLKEWAEKMISVHGDPGIMGVIWSLSSLYRDIIMKELRCFPHLFLFGPPESGKSYLGWSLSSLFGIPNQPFHLSKGTHVGFSRRLAQVRNGISWFDEYSNSISDTRVEGLKGAYDGTGHERGVKSMDNRTDKTKPLSACLITGQQVPIKDPALFTRCITMSFQKKKHTSEEKERGKQLKELEATGLLSQITAYLQQYRGKIKRLFSREMSAMRSKLESNVVGPSGSDRIMMNYSVPLTVMHILDQEGVEFPFSLGKAMNVCLDTLRLQAKQIVHEDEVGQWWQIFEYLVSDDKIQEGDDYSIGDPTGFTIRDDKGETRRVEFDSPTRTLFVNFSKTHGLYQEYMRRHKNITGLSKQGIMKYLEQQPYFKGHLPSRRFEGGVKACYAFKIGYGEDSLELTWAMSDDAFMDDIVDDDLDIDEKKKQLREEEIEMRENRPEHEEDIPF